MLFHLIVLEAKCPGVWPLFYMWGEICKKLIHSLRPSTDSKQ